MLGVLSYIVTYCNIITIYRCHYSYMTHIGEEYHISNFWFFYILAIIGSPLLH